MQISSTSILYYNGNGRIMTLIDVTFQQHFSGAGKISVERRLIGYRQTLKIMLNVLMISYRNLQMVAKIED